MDPFRADYYSFRDPQNWPKLSPAPKTEFLGEQFFGTLFFLEQLFATPVLDFLGPSVPE